MFRLVFLVFSLIAFPCAVTAQNASGGDASQEHGPGVRGTHGGPVQHLGDYEAELVVKGGSIVLQLTARATGKPVKIEGMRATIFVVQGSRRKLTIALVPKDGTFQANAAIPSGSDAVVSMQLPGGKSSQARFELGGHQH